MPGNETVKVVVRCRPLFGKVNQHSQLLIQTQDIFVVFSITTFTKSIQFDHVY